MWKMMKIGYLVAKQKVAAKMSLATGNQSPAHTQTFAYLMYLLFQSLQR